MTTNGEVVINLATGLEDPERVTVAFLVAGGAAQAGKHVTMFLTKEAVRLALPDVAQGVACDGCPPLPTLAAQYADAGGRMLVCPVCLGARKLSEDELIDGAPARRRHPAVAMDRRGRHRLQLLSSEFTAHRNRAFA